MADPFARKTYLHAVPDDVLPVRFSLGKRSRALQLQAFFRALEAAADGRLGEPVQLELVVLTAYDWRHLLSAPYGWGLARRVEAGVSIALPAGYPPRLIARWDAVRLRAAQRGARAPGGVAAFLDTYLGLEWAHARLLGEGGRKRVPAWLREVQAAYLYQQSLHRLKDRDRLAFLEAWAKVQQQGGGGELSGEDEDMDTPPQPFAYPRARMRFPTLLVTQGELWLQAVALGMTAGWDLTPDEVQARLKGAARVPLEPL